MSMRLAVFYQWMKIIKIKLAIALLLVQVLAFSAQTRNKNAPTDNKLKSEVDLLVQESAQIFMDDPRAVKLSIGIYKGGKAYTFNYGQMVRGKNKLPTKRTIYEIASITKTFTGFLLAQAIIEKKVNIGSIAIC